MVLNTHNPTPQLLASNLRTLFDAQYQSSRGMIDVPLALRQDRLQRLHDLIETNASELAQAVQSDFGVRSVQLTDVADLLVLRALLASTLKSLAKWMRPVKVRTPIYLQPAHGYLQRQPLGVVGVVSPWNYPLQLALAPAITALAAGNRVMLKPSELTPHTSALLASLINQRFAADEFCVVLSDAAAPPAEHARFAAEFVSLPFDHLFFTGSTSVGRKVAAAAAANLTPTTLELGGKSPCIIDASCDLDKAAIKIAHGKLLNAGQTCIAPDYVMLPAGMEAAFSKAFSQAVCTLFPTIQGNSDYAAIISQRHAERLYAMATQAESAGARLEIINPDAKPVVGTALFALSDTRQLPPVLVFDAPDSAQLMQEEIFGPILPVLPYASLDEAIQYVNARPRPLALYWFGEDSASRDKVLAQTVSGGVTVNDTLMHIAHENLPFGGVGESGWGSYHGEAGFLRMTQQKPVLVQSKWARGDLFYPPYGKRFDQVMGLLKRFIL